MTKCSICSHSKIHIINNELLKGEKTQREIAMAYGFSESALSKHFNTHLTAAMVNSAQSYDIAKGDDTIEAIRYYESEARRFKALAEDKEDIRDAMQAMDRGLKCIELMAKVIGLINERAQVNIYLSEEWKQVGMVIMCALEPFPEARQRVSLALMQLEKERLRELPAPTETQGDKNG